MSSLTMLAAGVSNVLDGWQGIASHYKVATWDTETDPFEYGKTDLQVFAWGFQTLDDYTYYWGNDAIPAFLDFLESLEEPHLIYAHNGGKFDFMFIVQALGGNIRIVNGRILEAHIGEHVIRDSYAILPIPLSEYRKDDIDYMKLHARVREQHKTEILSYLQTDCQALYELVAAFICEFGLILTIGSASMKQFKKFHPFEKLSPHNDLFMRDFYFGGRCQCFEKGVIRDRIEVWDVNSMYPDAMKRKRHPISKNFNLGSRINRNTDFVCFEGENLNALPTRTKKGLDFQVSDGRFFCSIHEFIVAEAIGVIKVKRIIFTVEFHSRVNFEEFVDHFYESRQLAKKNKDKFRDIFYKLILNSSYGKLAQDPREHKDYIILPYGEFPKGYIAPDDAAFDETLCWSMDYVNGQMAVWGKPVTQQNYYNVATAASITGAARANLLAGLSRATRPLYCDTDSIICKALEAEKDDAKLGAWKLDSDSDRERKKNGTAFEYGDWIAIAGKKMYALFNGSICLKLASKGVRLTPQEIVEVAQGHTVQYYNPVPAFKPTGKHQVIHRTVRMT